MHGVTAVYARSSETTRRILIKFGTGGY